MKVSAQYFNILIEIQTPIETQTPCSSWFKYLTVGHKNKDELWVFTALEVTSSKRLFFCVLSTAGG